jgi:hypothetical protein
MSETNDSIMDLVLLVIAKAGMPASMVFNLKVSGQALIREVKQSHWAVS